MSQNKNVSAVFAWMTVMIYDYDYNYKTGPVNPVHILKK